MSSHDYGCWLCDFFLPKYPRYVYVFIFTVMHICSCKNFSRIQVGIKWHFPGDTLQTTSERLVKNNFEGFLFIRIISEWHLLLSPLLWKSNKMLIVRKLAYSVVLLIRCLLLPVVIGLTPGLKSKGSKILVFQQSVKECLRSLILDSLQRSLFPHRLLTTWGI